MKTRLTVIPALLISLSAIAVTSGCSTLTGSSESEGKEISTTGPTILNARAEPSTVELNRALQPMATPEVLADVKDFRSDVSDVRLRFLHVPLELPMEKVGGTTWRATLSPEQLQMLAVSGKTISYDANIIAKNDKGQTAVSKSPVQIAISTPDVATTTG